MPISPSPRPPTPLTPLTVMNEGTKTSNEPLFLHDPPLALLQLYHMTARLGIGAYGSGNP